MRSAAFLMVLAGCGANNAAPTDSFAFQGPCAYPLAADGGLVFSDTAAGGVQSDDRVLDVINTTGHAINGRALLDWQFEGEDASDFSLGGGTEAPDSCFLHERLPVSFEIGQTCRVSVQFHPAEPGVKHVMLHLTRGSSDADIDQMIPIHATAAAVPIGVYADKSDLYLDSFVSFPQNLRIHNNGATSVDLGVRIVPSSFSSSWTCASQLGPLSSCDVSVSVQADASGCPTGLFTTSTSVVSVPLSTRGTPG